MASRAKGAAVCVVHVRKDNSDTLSLAIDQQIGGETRRIPVEQHVVREDVGRVKQGALSQLV